MPNGTLRPKTPTANLEALVAPLAGPRVAKAARLVLRLALAGAALYSLWVSMDAR